MTKSVTKTHLLKLIKERLGDSVSKEQVAAVFDTLVVEIIELTADGEEIHLNELGNFEVKKIKGRTVVANWQEGKPSYTIPAKLQLKFKSSDSVNQQIAELQQPPKRRQADRDEIVAGLLDIVDDD